MSYTNYGIVFKKGSTIVGEIIRINAPSIETGKKEISHATTGKRRFIPTGLITMSDLVVTINGNISDIATLYADLLAGSSSTAYTIDFPSATSFGDWTFNSFPTNIKANDTDANNPDAMQVEVTFAVASFASFDIT